MPSEIMIICWIAGFGAGLILADEIRAIPRKLKTLFALIRTAVKRV